MFSLIFKYEKSNNHKTYIFIFQLSPIAPHYIFKYFTHIVSVAKFSLTFSLIFEYDNLDRHKTYALKLQLSPKDPRYYTRKKMNTPPKIFLTIVATYISIIIHIFNINPILRFFFF